MPSQAPIEPETRRRQSARVRMRFPRVLATAALVPAALGLIACGQESSGPEAGGGGQGGTTNAQGTSAPQQPREVTLDELNTNTRRYMGQKVTVSGEVQQVVVSPGAFTVGSTGDENAAVVVLPTKKAKIPSNRLSEGDTVRVQGTVRPVSARISQDDDFLFEDREGFNEEQELFQEFKNRVGIAASKVDARIPEENR